MISSVEGIGGEVIQFFLFLGIAFLCFILWLSTRVRNSEEPFFRTVYVLESRVGSNNNTIPNDLNIQSTRIENSRQESRSRSSTDPEINQSLPSVEPNAMNDNEADVEENKAKVDVPKVLNGQCSTSNENGSQSLNNTSDIDSSSQKTGKITKQTDSNIKVRLKYTNDDSREVRGFLSEKLLDFKRRNFPEEISANKLVRLIFNGRLLRDDNVSLQSYGLFDDCVVHCLIINELPMQPTNVNQQEHPQSYSLNNDQANAPEWNLSKMLCFMVVGFLSLTWYCRFQFAALFTFTSTSFLFALTVIFVFSMFGSLYVESVGLNSVG